MPVILAIILFPWLAHNLHVSHARMVVEDRLAVVRIRFFKHDLEDAMRAFHRMPDIVLLNDERSDSLFQAYLGPNFGVVSAGDTLSPHIVASGEEQDIWWYELQYRAPSPIQFLTISNTTLFDFFSDQKNIIQVLFLPTEKRETLYFVAGSDRYDVTF